MRIIILKELKELLYSPKFLLLFSISTVLTLVSIFSGYTAYKIERKSDVLARETALDEIETLESYERIKHSGYRVTRSPEKLSIFNTGIGGVVGRKADIKFRGKSRPGDSRYSLDPILAVFGELDLSFFVCIIASLFAILFSYNSLNGERESGTLRLMMANSLRRTSVVIGKLIGGFLPLALLLLLPMAIGLAGLLLFTDMGFTGDEWLRIYLMALACLLYIFVFFNIGLAMSALTRSSFVSFLLCLSLWILSVAVIPRLAVQAAAVACPSISIDEVESRIRAFYRERENEFGRLLVRYLEENPIRAGEDEKFQNLRRRVMSEWENENQEHFEKLFNEYSRGRNGMLRTAVGIARVSPTSSLSFILNRLSETGPDMLNRFENNLTAYRKALIDYLDRQQAALEAQDQKRERTRFMYGIKDGFYYARIIEGDESSSMLNLDGLPQFSVADPTLEEVSSETLPDFTLLVIYALGFFAIACVAFLRYDMR